MLVLDASKRPKIIIKLLKTFVLMIMRRVLASKRYARTVTVKLKIVIQSALPVFLLTVTIGYVVYAVTITLISTP